MKKDQKVELRMLPTLDACRVTIDPFVEYALCKIVRPRQRMPATVDDALYLMLLLGLGNFDVLSGHLERALRFAVKTGRPVAAVLIDQVLIQMRWSQEIAG